MSTNAPNIIPGAEAKDQVILPNSVAFGICMRGIKARLGRSIVTLLGVSFGIAFLMSVLAGFHIKKGMHSHEERMRVIDRYVKAAQSEIGVLRDKTVLLLLGPGNEMSRDFAESLATDHLVKVKCLAADGALPLGSVAVTDPSQAPEAAVAIGLGSLEGIVTDSLLGKLKERSLIVFQKEEGLAQRCAAAGVRFRHLGIELRDKELQRQALKARKDRNRSITIVLISLLITVIGIANAMLMSVTERFREIGTMKCLGSLSSFVVKLFLIESSMVGFVGSVLGVLVGVVFPILGYSYQFGLGRLFNTMLFDMSNLSGLFFYGGLCVVVGVILSILAGIYPARVAAKMIPAVALSSHV